MADINLARLGCSAVVSPAARRCCRSNSDDIGEKLPLTNHRLTGEVTLGGRTIALVPIEGLHCCYSETKRLSTCVHMVHYEINI